MSALIRPESPTRAGLRVLSGVGDLQRSGVWIACLVLAAYNVATTSRFLSLQTLQTNLTQMAAVAIAAFGMTLVIATGGIDLSVGSLMALAGASGGLLLLSARSGSVRRSAARCWFSPPGFSSPPLSG